MHINKINIQNFRLLENVELILEDKTTVIVGRNNSGKTSLTEFFRRLLDDTAPTFLLEDFSLGSHEGFWKAFHLYATGKDENEVRAALPMIQALLTVSYADETGDLGPLTEFIIDLNLECTEALIIVRYELAKGGLGKLFDEIEIDGKKPIEDQKTQFCAQIKDRLPKLYSASLSAQDPNDETNQKPLEWKHLGKLVQSGFINAQRGLDDASRRDGADQKKNNVLGAILEQLFATASKSSDPEDQAVIAGLQTAIGEIQEEIREGFNVQLENLLPAFKMFGYPGLSDPRLRTETTLDVQRLLKNHTKVHYAGINGVNLPEAYNGLGTRNLIYILLQLLEFYKECVTGENGCGTHLVFIEEPEAHLHPQMQEVFIQNLNELAATFATSFKGHRPWPVQFVVTTHSPHMANKADFEAMRYFMTKSDAAQDHIRTTVVKDLKKGLKSIPVEEKKFLHNYMTLTRCDLLFADKIILIEGSTERILLPEFVKKVDSEGQPDKLASQYLSVLEVGGAHAHIFTKLLDFLDLKTLIITDLDSVDAAGEACVVSAGVKTSNNALIDWFGDKNITPANLIAKTDTEKTKGNRRIVYQVPESAGGDTAKSFEDAFIMANRALFKAETLTPEQVRAMTLKQKKTTFALDFALVKTKWVVPRYINEGLHWLAQSDATTAGTTKTKTPKAGVKAA